MSEKVCGLHTMDEWVHDSCPYCTQIRLAARDAEIERLRAIEKNLRDANHRWEEESQKLRECLRAVGSDGSPHDSVFSEAIAVITHWRSEMDRFARGAGR